MPQAALVVDDVADWSAMLAGFITDFYPEVEVVEVRSLEEAKRSLEERTYDVAFIDIRLDERDEKNIDGIKLMEFMSIEYPETVIVMVTGYADLDTVRQSMRPRSTGERPVVDFLEKDKLHIELRSRLDLVFGAA